MLMRSTVFSSFIEMPLLTKRSGYDAVDSLFELHRDAVADEAQRLGHSIYERSAGKGISALSDGIYHNADEEGEKSKQNLESGAFKKFAH